MAKPGIRPLVEWRLEQEDGITLESLLKNRPSREVTEFLQAKGITVSLNTVYSWRKAYGITGWQYDRTN